MTRLFISLVLLLFLACGGADNSNDTSKKSAPSSMVKAPEASSASDELMEKGKTVYNTYCFACHMEDGNGVPNLNPPLGDTKYVNGDKKELIGIVLNGLNGPLEVKGVTYNSVMAPHNFLSDEDIAGVLTYVRNSFGNSSSAVTPEEVAAVRAGS